jgi:hypothetical protein
LIVRRCSAAERASSSWTCTTSRPRNEEVDLHALTPASRHRRNSSRRAWPRSARAVVGLPGRRATRQCRHGGRRHSRRVPSAGPHVTAPASQPHRSVRQPASTSRSSQSNAAHWSTNHFWRCHWAPSLKKTHQVTSAGPAGSIRVRPSGKAADPAAHRGWK